MNRVGIYFLEADLVADAIEMFKLNVATYRSDPNTYDSLGKAYEKAENFAAAKENYEKAVQLATEADHPALAEYEKNFRRARRKAK